MCSARGEKLSCWAEASRRRGVDWLSESGVREDGGEFLLREGSGAYSLSEGSAAVRGKVAGRSGPCSCSGGEVVRMAFRCGGIDLEESANAAIFSLRSLSSLLSSG